MSGLSRRSQRALARPPRFVEAFRACAQSPYDRATNPGGYVQLGVATNRVCQEELAALSRELVRMERIDFEYRDFRGTPELRQAIGHYLGRRHGAPVDPEHLVLGTGATSLLESLAFHLCDDGEGIVVPAPYYQAIPYDLSQRMGVATVPLPCREDFSPELSALERVVAEAPAPVRAVLLVNPHNPTCRILPEQDAAGLLAQCERLGLHLVVDEAYRECLLGGRAFRSFLSSPSDRVHVVSSFAKDFGACGLSVGYAHTRNGELLSALALTSPLARVANPIQRLLARLLTDDAALDRYLGLMRERLEDSARLATSTLRQLGIPFIEPEAGLFVFCDLSARLGIATFADEQRWSRRLLEEHRFYALPGQGLGCPRPGWFRLCHAVGLETLEEAMRRLSAFAGRAPLERS